MPWDAGGVPEELERYLATHANGGRVLVPGCGSGYEVRAFAEHGYEVVAIDFSEAAMEKAAEVLGDLKSAVVLGDFFTHDFGEPFDLVYGRHGRSASPVSCVRAAGSPATSFTASSAVGRRTPWARARRKSCWDRGSTRSTRRRWRTRCPYSVARSAGKCGCGADEGRRMISRKGQTREL